MNEKINTQELIDIFATELGTTKRDAELFIRTLTAQLEQGLKRDKIVKIKDLGTFKIVKVNARKSVDVSTKEQFEIPGHYKVTFTPDNTLRDLVNEPFSAFEPIELSDDYIDETIEVDTPNNIEEEERSTPQEKEPPTPIDNYEEIRDGNQEPIWITHQKTTEIERQKESERDEEDTTPIPLTLPNDISTPLQETQTDEVIMTAETTPITHADTTTTEETPKPDMPEAMVGSTDNDTPATIEEKEDEEEEEEEEEKEKKEETEETKEIAQQKKAAPNPNPNPNPDKTKKSNKCSAIVIILLFIVIFGCILNYRQKKGEAPKATEQTTQHSKAIDTTAPPSDTTTTAAANSTVSIQSSTAITSQVEDNIDQSRHIDTVTMKKGMWLASLARKYYGDKDLWKIIYEENKSHIKNADNIPLGTTLYIPRKELYD